MSKPVTFTGDLTIGDWQVIARYEYPELFDFIIFQDGEGESMRIRMTKDQFTDLRNLLRAVDCAEQIII